ncbi:MAG: hypothetical protein HRU19_12630 [Pseudobacteriovorax sp.]|nr:hypothetical protein [Pseudobacteriovorax sp.]
MKKSRFLLAFLTFSISLSFNAFGQVSSEDFDSLKRVTAAMKAEISSLKNCLSTKISVEPTAPQTYPNEVQTRVKFNIQDGDLNGFTYNPSNQVFTVTSDQVNGFISFRPQFSQSGHSRRILTLNQINQSGGSNILLYSRDILLNGALELKQGDQFFLTLQTFGGGPATEQPELHRHFKFFNSCS